MSMYMYVRVSLVTGPGASGGPSCASPVAGDPERSMPAQKILFCGSEPVRTTHLTRGSELSMPKAFSSDSIMSVLKAFLCSGRLSMTMTTGVTVLDEGGWCKRRTAGSESSWYESGGLVVIVPVLN